DLNWGERYELEQRVAASSLKRAPFTEFIAFVRLEWFLKTMCDRSGIVDMESNEERIKALEGKGRISRTHADLLQDARRARNKWFHEGKPPNRELMDRLV